MIIADSTDGGLFENQPEKWIEKYAMLYKECIVGLLPEQNNGVGNLALQTEKINFFAVCKKSSADSVVKKGEWIYGGQAKNLSEDVESGLANVSPEKIWQIMRIAKLTAEGKISCYDLCRWSILPRNPEECACVNPEFSCQYPCEECGDKVLSSSSSAICGIQSDCDKYKKWKFYNKAKVKQCILAVKRFKSVFRA